MLNIQNVCYFALLVYHNACCVQHVPPFLQLRCIQMFELQEKCRSNVKKYMYQNKTFFIQWIKKIFIQIIHLANKLFIWMIHFTEISEKSIFPNLICHLLLLYFTILKKLYLVLILFFLKDVMKELISVCFVFLELVMGIDFIIWFFFKIFF